MTVGSVTRIVVVLAACVAAAGSATSRSSSQRSSLSGPGDAGPPPPQQMEASRALGLWRSTFGPVKIEADNSQGGLSAGNLQGVWVYERQGEEVVGYFAGNLRGNVLEFRWQEPNDPPLTGEGYLVFDVQGRQYAGRWWSDKRDRVGDWNGWRPRGSEVGSYGSQGYGYSPPQPSPYRRSQPYRQPQPYPSQQPPPYAPAPAPPAQPYRPSQQPPYPSQPGAPDASDLDEDGSQQPPQRQSRPTYF